jgi:alkylhydroperoxidase/carboxymuconolactone decarboxylase family protein YurZ
MWWDYSQYSNWRRAQRAQRRVRVTVRRSALEQSLHSGVSAKTKQLIAVAVAHVTQPTKAALRHGVTREELIEAIWVAAEMRAGGVYAHSAIALNAIDSS